MPNNLGHSGVQNLRCHFRKLWFFLSIPPNIPSDSATVHLGMWLWETLSYEVTKEVPLWMYPFDSKAEGFSSSREGRKKMFPFAMPPAHVIVVLYTCDYFPDIRKILLWLRNMDMWPCMGNEGKGMGTQGHKSTYSFFCLLLLFFDFLSHTFWNVSFKSYDSHRILNNIHASYYVPWTSITGTVWKLV